MLRSNGLRRGAAALLALSAAGSVWGPRPAVANHWLLHKHKMGMSASFAGPAFVGFGVPQASMVGFAPQMSAMSFAAVPQASMMAMVPQPQMSMVAMVPQSQAMMVGMAPSGSLASLAAVPSGAVSPASIATASNAAFAASAEEAASAGSQYPSLAAAAQARGLDGGRFVVLLKNLLLGKIGGGTIGKAFLRDVLVNAVRAFLGIDPSGTDAGTDLEKLLGDLLGDGSGGGGGGTGGGNCFTIRICVEGGRVIGGGGGTPDTGDTRFNDRFGGPASAISAAKAQLQAAATASGQQAAGVTPAGDLAEQRHQQIMAKLEELIQAMKAGPK